MEACARCGMAVSRDDSYCCHCDSKLPGPPRYVATAKRAGRSWEAWPGMRVRCPKCGDARIFGFKDYYWSRGFLGASFLLGDLPLIVLGVTSLLLAIVGEGVAPHEIVGAVVLLAIGMASCQAQSGEGRQPCPTAV
jgi:hypothetical protein